MYRLFIATLLIAVSVTCDADELTRAQITFFETKIRPVLVSSCYECHSKETGKNEGGLTLDTKVGLRLGGNSGEGVVPGDFDESWIWLAVSHTDPDVSMPPKAKLPASVIADFKRWIEMGAPDPREDNLPSVVNSSIDIDEGREFWSFQSPQKTSPPKVEIEEWSQTAVDRFVRAKLETEEMVPSVRAEPATLLRRLYFDLIGLPPTPVEITRFQSAWKKDSVRAIEATVDRLLKSRHFGERWGRHWLDVARYAESNGKQANQSYPNAWRYRDYVIDSFNNDKAYDRFVQEQIAGDLLPAKTDAKWQEGIIATSFLAIGPKNLKEKSTRQFTMDLVDEQIDSTTQAILGLTVACARCHDHKTDPIPTADYYALAGILLSSKTYYGTFGAGNRLNVGDSIILPVPGSKRERLTSREIASIKKRLAEIDIKLGEYRNNKLAMMQQDGEISAAPQTGNGKTAKRGSPRVIRNEQSSLNAKLASVGSNGLINEYSMGMQDRDAMVDANLLIRGEVDSPAQQVPRGFLNVLNHAPKGIRDDRSGRIELAQWLTSRENPMTARVMVNRVWDKLFGRGLVSSTNNFGQTGMAPTHPELLDYLAVQFMEDDWSVKSLIRDLVLTRTYQADSRFNEANFARDPENELLWRAAPRRLDAEALRDSMLAVTGQLDLERPIGSAVSEAGDIELGRRSSPDLLSGMPPVRSVYLPAVREGMHELIQLFDGADSNVVTGSREATNVAGQALFLMNSPFILEQSDVFAGELQQRFDKTNDRVRFAFWKAYGRPPSSGELQSTVQFYKRFLAAATKQTKDRQQAEKMFLTSFCQSLLSSAEFRFLN